MKRDWEIPDVPCEGGDCTPENPTCAPCIAGRAAMLAEGFVKEPWHELSEFAREQWRIDGADA